MLDNEDLFMLYMLENEGETEVVSTRISRINWAVNQVLRGSPLSIIELLEEKGITELSDSEMTYLTRRMMED